MKLQVEEDAGERRHGAAGPQQPQRLDLNKADAVTLQKELNGIGKAKAEALAQRFPGGFDYAGDSSADLEVWKRARNAITAVEVPRIRSRPPRLSSRLR